jgi:ankyrin repeat protein
MKFSLVKISSVLLVFASLSYARGAMAARCNKPNANVAKLFEVIQDPQKNVSDVETFLHNYTVGLDAHNEFCLNPLQAAIRTRKTDLIKFLFQRSGILDVNAVLDSEDNYEATTIYKDALRYADLASIRFIQSRGGRLSDGQTPVMFAAANNTTDVVYNLLKEKGATVSGINKDGKTALFYAARTNNAAMVSYLLKAGLSVNAVDSSGLTPLMHAALGNTEEVVSTLIRAGARVNEKCFSVDYNKGQKFGNTALMYSAMGNRRAGVTKVLIQAGAQVNAVEIDGGNTALIYAAGTNTWDVVNILLQAGANINADTHNGFTALQRSTGGRGDYAVAFGLLAAGADPNVHTDVGWPALMNAVHSGPDKLVKALLDAGANKNYSDGFNTPYKLAVEKKRSKEIIALLKP